MHYKYLYAKHIDQCQKEITSVHSLLSSFLVDFDRIAKNSQINGDYHRLMLVSASAILDSASKIITEIQTDLYGSPPTVPTDSESVLFVKQTGAGAILSTQEPDELRDFDDADDSDD